MNETLVITVVFGAYDLSDQFEDGKIVRSPSRIFKHEDWNEPTTTTGSFYADIAMFLMPEKIVFSTFVKPICLWESDDELKSSIGVVAGWGRSDGVHQVGTIPTMVVLTVRKPGECNLVQRSFCAGIADGRGPCEGDSGSGFIVQSGDAYFLKGIVSHSKFKTFCGNNKYAVYTDVLKFKAWIDRTMKKR